MFIHTTVHENISRWYLHQNMAYVHCNTLSHHWILVS